MKIKITDFFNAISELKEMESAGSRDKLIKLNVQLKNKTHPSLYSDDGIYLSDFGMFILRDIIDSAKKTPLNETPSSLEFLDTLEQKLFPPLPFLPGEIKFKIATFLDKSSQTAMERTSKEWRSVINELKPSIRQLSTGPYYGRHYGVSLLESPIVTLLFNNRIHRFNEQSAYFQTRIPQPLYEKMKIQKTTTYSQLDRDKHLFQMQSKEGHLTNYIWIENNSVPHVLLRDYKINNITFLGSDNGLKFAYSFSSESDNIFKLAIADLQTRTVATITSLTEPCFSFIPEKNQIVFVAGSKTLIFYNIKDKTHSSITMEALNVYENKLANLVYLNNMLIIHFISFGQQHVLMVDLHTKQQSELISFSDGNRNSDADHHKKCITFVPQLFEKDGQLFMAVSKNVTLDYATTRKHSFFNDREEKIDTALKTKNNLFARKH